MDTTVYGIGTVYVQILCMVIAILIIVIEIYHLRCCAQRLPKSKSFLLVFWMGHALTYYTVALLDHFQLVDLQLPVQLLTGWSAALRLHGLTSMLLISAMCLYRSKLADRSVRSAMYGSDFTRDDN